MQTNTQNAAANALWDWTSLVGRAGLAALFLWSGYGKLVYMDGNVGYMKAYGMPAAELLIWPVLLFEFVAGAMLAVGFKVRWAALGLAVFTASATLIFHNYWSVPADQMLNQQIHFLKNVAIIGGLLGVVAYGAGRLGLDR